MPWRKSEKFYSKNDRTVINQWLMGQMGYIGPMLGQHHQFHHYNPGKVNLEKIGTLKYPKEFIELDDRLSNSKFLREKIIQLLILQHFHGLQDMSGMIGLSKFKISRDGIRMFLAEKL